MSEIKILKVVYKDGSKSKGECQICHINHTKRRYELHCELIDMDFKLILCKECYMQTNLPFECENY